MQAKGFSFLASLLTRWRSTVRARSGLPSVLSKLLNAIRSDITRGAACAKKFSLSPSRQCSDPRVTDFCDGAKVMNGDNAGSSIRSAPAFHKPLRLNDLH